MNAKQLLEHLKHLEKLKYPLEMFPVSVEMDAEFIDPDTLHEIFISRPDCVGIEGGEFKFSAGFTETGFKR